MDKIKRQATAAKSSCIIMCILAVGLFIGVAGYAEFLRFSTNSSITYFGDGGLFSNRPILPILLGIAGLPIPFVGIGAGTYALNNLESEQYGTWFIRAYVVNLLIFIPVFLIVAYFFLLFLNQL